MKVEEDENYWFGMEESMSICTTPCNLNFHSIKLHNLKNLLLQTITLYFINETESFMI